MTHWADQYVGLPPEGAWPCWALVRKVWMERIGFFMPSFDGQEKETAVRLGSEKFHQVAVGDEQELDAVLIWVPKRDASADTGFRNAETHIGVVAAKGLVLHVEQGRASVIEPIKRVKVSRVLRGPWA